MVVEHESRVTMGFEGVVLDVSPMNLVVFITHLLPVPERLPVFQTPFVIV